MFQSLISPSQLNKSALLAHAWRVGTQSYSHVRTHSKLINSTVDKFLESRFIIKAASPKNKKKRESSTTTEEEKKSFQGRSAEAVTTSVLNSQFHSQIAPVGERQKHGNGSALIKRAHLLSWQLKLLWKLRTDEHGSNICAPGSFQNVKVEIFYLFFQETSSLENFPPLVVT